MHADVLGDMHSRHAGNQQDIGNQQDAEGRQVSRGSEERSSLVCAIQCAVMSSEHASKVPSEQSGRLKLYSCDVWVCCMVLLPAVGLACSSHACHSVLPLLLLMQMRCFHTKPLVPSRARSWVCTCKKQDLSPPAVF